MRGTVVRRAGATALLVGAVLMTGGCGGQTAAVPQADHTFHDPDFPDFADTALGEAKFDKYVLKTTFGRTVSIVDVSDAYPDPDGTVEGAHVLVDREQRGAAKDDFEHRPVVVRYTGLKTAEAAVAGAPKATYALRGDSVIWVPATMPKKLAYYFRYVGAATFG